MGWLALDRHSNEQKRAKSVRSTDGKIIPISNQDFEIWNGTLLLYEYLEESPNCVPIPKIHFLKVNMHEQQFYGFVYFLD